MVEPNFELEWEDLENLTCAVGKEEDTLICSGETENGDKVKFEIPITSFNQW